MPDSNNVLTSPVSGLYNFGFADNFSGKLFTFFFFYHVLSSSLQTNHPPPPHLLTHSPPSPPHPLTPSPPHPLTPSPPHPPTPSPHPQSLGSIIRSLRRSGTAWPLPAWPFLEILEVFFSLVFFFFPDTWCVVSLVHFAKGF